MAGGQFDSHYSAQLRSLKNCNKEGVRLKKKNRTEPWITNDVLDSIGLRNGIFCRFILLCIEDVIELCDVSKEL